MTVSTVQLKDLIRVHYGHALKKADRDDSGAYPVFGSHGEVGKHTDRLVDYPTLIVGRKGSVGAVTYAPSGGWPIDTAFFVEMLEPDSLDLRYLYYALRQCHLEDRVITTSIPGLSRDDIYSAKIPLPPLPEQRRIAAILDKADAVRRKRQQTLDLADDFLRSAFLDLFGNPVTDPHARTAVMTELITRFIDYRGKSPEKSEAGIPLITARIVKEKEIKTPNEFIPSESYDTWMRRGIPTPGDVIITTEAPMGEVALVPDYKAAFAQRLLVLQPDRTRVEPIYLMWALTMPFVIRQLQQRSTGSTVTGIRSKEFRKVNLPAPPLELQRRFAAVVTSVERLKASQRAHLTKLETLFASLQSRAFRGELCDAFLSTG